MLIFRSQVRHPLIKYCGVRFHRIGRVKTPASALAYEGPARLKHRSSALVRNGRLTAVHSALPMLLFLSPRQLLPSCSTPHTTDICPYTAESAYHNSGKHKKFVSLPRITDPSRSQQREIL